MRRRKATGGFDVSVKLVSSLRSVHFAVFTEGTSAGISFPASSVSSA